MLLPEANIKNRIEAIDALRGIALLGITLRHFLTRFNHQGWVYSDNALVYKADRLFEWISYHLLYGTVYSIFAFLFGFSFYLLQRKVSSRGISQYLVIRLLVLGLFACINSAFFPGGDILGLYVVLGLMMVLLIRLPLQWLLVICVILLLQPVDWGRVLLPPITALYDELQTIYAGLKEQIVATSENGTVAQNIWVNITRGQLAGIVWTMITGRFLQTLGLMLLGFCLGKNGVLVNVLKKGKFAIRYTYIPVLLCVLIYSAQYWLIHTGNNSENLLHLILSNWMDAGVSALYIILFFSMYNYFFKNGIPSLKYYGRMSLTNYVGSTLFGGALLAPYGWDFSLRLSSSFLFVVFVIVVFFSFWFSRVWLANYKYGPLEWCWRKMVAFVFDKKYNRAQFFFNT